MKLLLTEKTETLNTKYGGDCALCPPDRAVVRRLACLDLKFTHTTLSSGAMKRDALVCEDCIKEMRASEEVEVIEPSGGDSA